jgi:hypothetical protein
MTESNMEQLARLLKELKLGCIEEKLIDALVKDIENNNNLKDEHTVRSLSYLAHWLYVMGNDEFALNAAKIAGHVTGFKKEEKIIDACKYNCLVLCSYIYLRNFNDSEQSDIFWNKLLDMRFGDNVLEERKRITKKKWDRNIKTGDYFEAHDKNRQAAESNNHIRGVVYHTFRTLESLFWMYKMGGSEKYPLEKIGQMIDERIVYLKQNINNADVKDFV